MDNDRKLQGLMYMEKLRGITTPPIIAWTSLFFAFGIPFFFVLQSVLSGHIALWYDNARDLLSAWDNLSKPTLIGPTSGIPGIFYGPYWIWLLSISLIFSKDPRIVTLLVGVLPYFVLFPLLLLRFKPFFGIRILVLVWILFIFSVGIGYITNLWNPHFAPFLFLLLICLLTFVDFTKRQIKNYVTVLVTGGVAGLIINFHISFGLGVLLGILFFFIADFFMRVWQEKKTWKKIVVSYGISVLVFGTGVIVAFIPFLLFEVRHGFHQMQTAIQAFTSYGAVIALKGLSKGEVLQLFFGRLGVLLHIPVIFAFIVELVTVGYLLFVLKYKKIVFQKEEKRLAMLLIAISSGILFIYLTARNPVWDYHFISTEIIFLLFIALVVSKNAVVKNILTVWVIFVVMTKIISYTTSASANPLQIPYLSTKEYIVDTIANDAGKQPYTVFQYSPSIYTYEYTYLFKWKYDKDMPYDPGKTPLQTKLVYLIVSPGEQAVTEDFIQYRTPSATYKTTKQWKIPEGTTILKREKILGN